MPVTTNSMYRPLEPSDMIVSCSILGLICQTLTNLIYFGTIRISRLEMEEKEYMTEAEACSYLGISRGTLNNFVKRKLLNKYEQKVRRRVLYKKSEMDALRNIEPKQQP
jgi:excisionase family DNA binding protein